MSIENQYKGFLIEKAPEPLTEEKGIETEKQAKMEKLESLNNSKQDLENKLNEINSEIIISKYEAEKTRGIMQGGDWDKDDNFKEDYNSTISEVAGNLNELRNEKNKIKEDLEKIDSDIKNIDQEN